MNKSGKVDLNFELSGPDGAPVVVLAHPLATELSYWDLQASELDKNFRVLRYDARGHGRSATPDGPYSISMLAEDLLQLLDQLNIQQIHFCGLSIGGMTGIWLASHRPERIASLVLSNCLPYLGNPDLWNERANVARTQPLKGLVTQSAARWVSADFAANNPESMQRLIETAASMSNNAYAAYCELLGATDLRADLASIHSPTLVISGLKDVATPPEQCEFLAHSISGARFLTLKGAHFTNFEDSVAYTAAIEKFFKEVTQ